MLPKPLVLRLIWTIIEDIPSQHLIALSNTALIETLIQQLSNYEQFNKSEISFVSNYLESRIKLIKDTAVSRYSEESSPKPDNQTDSTVADAV